MDAVFGIADIAMGVVAIVVPLVSYAVLCQLARMPTHFRSIAPAPAVMLTVAFSELSWYNVHQPNTAYAWFTLVNQGILIPLFYAIYLFKHTQAVDKRTLFGKLGVYGLPMAQLVCICIIERGRTYAAVAAGALGVVASWLVVHRTKSTPVAKSDVRTSVPPKFASSIPKTTIF